MKKAITKRTTSLALILTLFLLLCTTLFIGVKNVFADETVYFKGYGENLSYSDLYNATNTYDFNPAALISPDNEKPWFSNNDWYDMSERNGNQVTDSAMITVFTYGYRGAVNNWSTDGYGNFAYDKQSIITQYSEYIYKNTNKKPEIYYAKLEGTEEDVSLNNFRLVRLNNDNNSNELYNANIDGQSVEYLGDLSKHTIIIFDTRKNYDSNNRIYSELNYILSRVIYNYRYMLNGILPGINLIGHSRGGLTNLQYTLDHPDLVKNVFSFDTPYADTTAGYIDGVKVEFEGEGFTDITDLDVYSKYRKRWNENYDRLYSNVRIHALGGYSTISDALELLQSNIDTLLSQMNNSELNITAEQVESIVNAVNFYFNWGNIISLPLFITGIVAIKTPIGLPLIALSLAAPNRVIDNPEPLLRTAYNLVKNLPIYEQVKDIVGDFSGLQHVIKDISYDNVVLVGSPMFYNDCTVDLNSQLGGVSAKERAYEAAQIAAGQEVTPAEAYKGFIKKTKQFTMSNVTRNENGEIKTGSAYSPCVVHLLAPYDKEFIDYVLDNVTFDGETNYGKGWQYQSNGNGTLCVTGYRGYYNEDVLEIPSTIEGKRVTAVDDLAFAGKFAEGRKISVIIPEGVMKIGYGAFNGCKAISSVSLPSSLTYIDDGAFADSIGETDLPVSIAIPSGVTKIGARAFKNTNISSVTLPSGLQKIGHEAFFGCGKLSNISVGQNVTEIGYNAFGNCDGLAEIIVAAQNANYATEDGVLYTKNKKTLLCYPSGKTATSFTVNTACTQLSNYAFENNPNLQTLNLNNVNTINSYAIINCSELATINAPKTNYIYSAGIAATKATEAEDLVVGRVLYKKTSAGETVKVDNSIESIAPYAFVGNDSVKKVVLGERISDICSYAFSGCSTLENIEIYNLNEVVSLGTGALDGVNANLSIKVPQKYLNTYKSETAKGWISFANNITTLDKHSVKYIVGDKVVKESLVDYGNEIGEDYKYIDGGYYAKTWKTADGTEIKGYYKIKDDIVLYGALEPLVYKITYDTMGGESLGEDEYNVEEDERLLIPTRTGYTFKGWHTSRDFTTENNIGSVILKGTMTGNITLYAEWEANTYIVSLKMFTSGGVVDKVDVVFGEPFVFDTVYSDGRIFNGWKDENGRMLTGSYGHCNFVWDIPKSTIVFADWTLIEYTITYPNADMPNNPTKFTVEDLPIVLQQATLRAARNDGWYLDERCTSEKIEKINELGDITLYAKWAYLFTLDFELNGGVWDNKAGYEVPYVVFSGDKFNLPTAKRDGYNKGCWSRNGSNYDFGDEFQIPENAINEYFSFTAVWSDPKSYTITFDFNGGTGVSSTTTRVTATFGKTVPNINFPVRAGYRFVAYKTTKDEKGVAYYTQTASGGLTKGTYDIVGDVTLYAQWEIVYPKLSIVSKSGGTWKIKIENVSSAMVSFDYNKKMLFEKDAKVWNVSDNDKGNVTIDAGSSKTVDITENWFATCIVVSMKIDSTRYITYAYNLDSNTKTLTPVNCYVSG